MTRSLTFELKQKISLTEHLIFFLPQTHSK